MTEAAGGPGADWVDGSLEAGADPVPADPVPADASPGGATGSGGSSEGDGEKGVGIGAGEPNSFEPEENAG